MQKQRAEKQAVRAVGGVKGKLKKKRGRPIKIVENYDQVVNDNAYVDDKI